MFKTHFNLTIEKVKIWSKLSWLSRFSIDGVKTQWNLGKLYEKIIYLCFYTLLCQFLCTHDSTEVWFNLWVDLAKCSKLRKKLSRTMPKIQLITVYWNHMIVSSLNFIKLTREEGFYRKFKILNTQLQWLYSIFW